MKGGKYKTIEIWHFPHYFMKRSWFPVLLVAALFALLSVLAFLQYRWLGQISDGERERLQRNLQTDTQRFAEDFNREIQNAYFNFQLPAENWRNRNLNEFNLRYNFWREKTAYPELIKDFYFVELENRISSRYNRDAGAFELALLPENLSDLSREFSAQGSFQPIAENIPVLLMAVHESNESFDRILVRRNNPIAPPQPVVPIKTPKRFGILIIELDENVIKNRIFPDLVKKYFSENESANYRLAVINRENQPVFQTENLTATDSSAGLFDLSTENFMFFANREALSTVSGERKSMVFSRLETKMTAAPGTDRPEIDGRVPANLRLRRRTPGSTKATGNRVEVEVLDDKKKSQVRIFESENAERNPIWTLNVQHTAGSLEQFITNTRNRNLAVSFGILSLLGVSIGLIFLSAQRAKLLAQRQVDFVSSVSHEFRTPLAVIYSAGENLSDGVIRDEGKISNYGKLIKREGKKLTAMVEQILEFAGANSGKRKYDFRAVNISKIINEAIAECQPLIEEKDFTVDKEFAENLPEISADEKALTQAVQNLIVNGLKYSNGSKWLKVSAQNGNRKLKIAVEDKGIGIEKSELGKIFEPFYRSKRVVNEQIHGNGLGLSLVRQTIDAHGGKIFVESEVGKGSKFSIQLPVINEQKKRN